MIALIGGGFLYLSQKGILFKSGVSGQETAEMAIKYINDNFLTQDNAASLVSVVDVGDVLKIRLKVGGQEYDSYVTKDGALLFPEGYNLNATSAQGSEENTTAEVEKRDTPDVKLFIMSYCPYGLQAQKMFLPVYDLLKDKANMGIYFVDYVMHDKKEIDENLNQYCIQKNEKNKFSNYLSCFVQSGDSQKCLAEVGIDQAKLSSCISETDAQYQIYSQYDDKSTWLNGTYPKFDINADLNENYGVGGSPTIVINDKIVNVSPRSPEKFKEIICSAFSSAPAECSQVLSGDAASAGIGGGTDNSDSNGGCGE